MFADMGCGTGYFTFPAAQTIQKGKVFAIDIQKEMLEVIEKKVLSFSGAEVISILSTETSIPLPDDSVDFAFMANVLHELEGISTLKEIYRILRNYSDLGIIEWKKIRMDMGPPLSERLSKEDSERTLLRGRFKTIGFFEAGPYHYALKAREII